MVSQISFTLFLILIITCFLISMKKKRKAKLPPGPGKIPIIGNLHQLGKLPHRSLQKLSKTYGDLMFLRLGFVPAIVISSPDRAREIIKAHDLAFSGRPPLYAVKKFSYNFSATSIAPYGYYWREIRKIVVMELMTARRVKSFEQIRAQEVATMVKHISSTFPGPVDLSSVVFSLSNNIVCHVAFGTTNDPGMISRFRGIMHEIQQLAIEFNVADFFPGMGWINRINGVDKRIDKNFQDLDRFFDKLIEEHRNRSRQVSENEDLIDAFLRIQKDPLQTINLTDEQLKGVIVLDVFVGGTETSATTIIWTMAELIRNPTVKQKVQQEVRNLAKGKKRIQETDLPKLTYLKQVIKESLRLHPPAPLLVPRETTERCIISNESYEIPAKTRVFFNAAAIATDPGYWENPNRFWPERFVNNEVDFRGKHFELLPFGVGRRSCPGIGFAIPVVELALANLLYCFDWELPEGLSVEDVDMEETPGITVHKKTPLCLVALPVENM